MPRIAVDGLICCVCGVKFRGQQMRGKEHRRYCSSRCRSKAHYREHAPHLTGTCFICSKPTVRRFCSPECRVTYDRDYRHMSMLRYVCAWCRREVERPAAEAHRNRYCSLSCERLDRAENVATPNLGPAFGHWFAGLVDGEGSFDLGDRGKVKTQRGSKRLSLTIGLRDDDLPTLMTIRSVLGFGYIYRVHQQDPNRNNKPRAVLSFSNVKQCAVLAEIFRQFPLRSKKARDCAIWTEAIERLLTGNTNQDQFASSTQQLRQTRQYPTSD